MGSLSRALLQALRKYDTKPKPLMQRLRSSIYLSNWFNPIYNVYTHIYVIPKQRIKRIAYYMKHIWSIGDWDYNWHLELLALSLKRLRRHIIEGTGVVSGKKKRKMDTTIGLLNRMLDPWESYHEPAYKAFKARWKFNDDGPVFKVENGRIRTFKDDFRETLDDQQKVLFDKEYTQILRVEDVMFKKDMELFCKLFSRHVTSWWD